MSLFLGTQTHIHTHTEWISCLPVGLWMWAWEIQFSEASSFFFLLVFMSCFIKAHVSLSFSSSSHLVLLGVLSPRIIKSWAVWRGGLSGEACSNEEMFWYKNVIINTLKCPWAPSITVHGTPFFNFDSDMKNFKWVCVEIMEFLTLVWRLHMYLRC